MRAVPIRCPPAGSSCGLTATSPAPAAFISSDARSTPWAIILRLFSLMAYSTFGAGMPSLSVETGVERDAVVGLGEVLAEYNYGDRMAQPVGHDTVVALSPGDSVPGPFAQGRGHGTQASYDA